MAQSFPLLMRLVASSITTANRAGKIIRDVMSKGELGIIDKVHPNNFSFVSSSFVIHFHIPGN